MRKWIIAIVVVVLLAGAGWYFGSPYLTLYQAKQAYERKDVDALIAGIDFDALKADIKNQAHVQARKEAAVDHSPIDPDVEASADQSIDSLVNPSALRDFLRDIMNTKKPAADKSGAADGDAAAASGSDTSKDLDDLTRNVTVERTAFDTFVVHGKDANGIQLTFTRRGLGWKLTGLRLPPSSL